MIIRSGELFYCCMCFIDELRGNKSNFIKQKCLTAWADMSQYIERKGFSLENEDVHFSIGLILYSAERVLALVEDYGYVSQLIEANLIEHAPAISYLLQKRFNRFYRTAGGETMQEWFSDYLYSEQIISEDIGQMAEDMDQVQNQTRTFQPRHIDKDGLADYFKAPFKGMGGGTNFFAMLINDLERDWTEKDCCIIANMIYRSNVMNDRRPNTFKEWYERFCLMADCPYNARREPRHHQPTEDMKRLFSYLV